MKQLTGLDAGFLAVESRTTTGHVASLSIYQRPHPEFDPYPTVHQHIAAMIGHVEPLHRRLVEVPLKLDHPYWVDDPEFDLDYHVRHIGLAPPGAAEQLADQVARIVARHLDRQRPLWEVYVIEGLADGRWGLLWKVHHAAIDGAAGEILLGKLTAGDPAAVDELPPVVWDPEALPSELELLTRTVRSLVTSPLKNLRLQLKVARQVADGLGVSSVSGVIGAVQQGVRRAAGLPTQGHVASYLPSLSPAPSTPFNKPISAARRFAMRSASLEDVKRLKNATDGTVNDVVMAVCAGALREYLLKHDALPEQPLRAVVPVSARTGTEEDPWTNRVSVIIAELPTHLSDPLERLAACQRAMQDAKRQYELLPADALKDVTQTTSPLLAAAATRLASRLAGHVNLPANLVISNVPGSRTPLYFAGARLDHYVPISIVTDGMGLNITVHSYLDRLDFGLVADRELVPDLWDLVDLHVDEVGVLLAATGA